MNEKLVEQLKNKTVELLLDPHGLVKLSYFQVVLVQCINENSKKGLLWYLEDEQSFIIEEHESEDFSFLTFTSVDELINNHWVIVES